MKYKAIIFDMDGTIISTEELWRTATENMLNKYTNHLSPEKKNEVKAYLKGLALYESCKYIQQYALDQVSVEEILAEKARQAHELYTKHGLSFIPFFPEFHQQVKDFNLKHAIATNATAETVEKTLTLLPLQDFFGEHIYHIDMVNRICKPKPDIFLHAAKNIQVDPEHCIVIEDSAHGIQAAKAAGMYCIAINTGNDRELLHKADEIVDCYTQINLQKLIFNN